MEMGWTYSTTVARPLVTHSHRVGPRDNDKRHATRKEARPRKRWDDDINMFLQQTNTNTKTINMNNEDDDTTTDANENNTLSNNSGPDDGAGSHDNNNRKIWIEKARAWESCLAKEH